MSFALEDLEGPLLAAHEQNDGAELVRLYTAAADLSEAAGDLDAACFYLPHAFVFALQEGDAASNDLQMRLWTHGREVRPAVRDMRA
jgi:hypothetical protein